VSKVSGGRKAIVTLLTMLSFGSVLGGDPAAGASPVLDLVDQYGEPIAYPLPDGDADSVVLIAASDRRGAEANRQWAERLADRYGRHIEGRQSPRLVILPVAHLNGVPGFMRGFVRSFFRGKNPEGETLIPIGLDWRGDVERQLGLEPGVPNVTVLDPSGRVVEQRAGDVEEVGGPIFEALDRLLGVVRTRGAAE
jgi:hypothetical protein